MSNRQSSATGGAGSNLAHAWVRASGHFMNSVVEANRATLAAFGLTDSDDVEEGTQSVAYNREDWETERTVDHADHISVGDHVTFTKTISEENVLTFADASGDTNRLHLDPGFAAQTRFGRNIAHGTLVSGLISAALARLPGLTIYLSQDVEFVGPVDIGDRLTATVEVAEDLGNNRYLLSTDVHDSDGTQIIEGEAVVLIDDAPDFS
ncbi:Acyl dehydratase [Halogranum rubrum]|uniref:Acyl dehydratase n=1 Tax=Halogranum rubrum TaxID=553466 RepID=A0A1I4BS18_9EURY|nr:MaoC family dehydratase [Halogranum rubrum]SFK71525.1 Acyl dehydratase [Halogranum rubrum]